MDTERNDYYEASKAQEKSREDLESYKEALKKELDSIKSLVSSEIPENNTANKASITSNNSISPVEYEKLKEENRTLRFENESLNSTNLMLVNDNKLLRENLERLNLQTSNTAELEIEITMLKEVILNLEKENLELRAKKPAVISKEQVSHDQNLPVDVSNEIKSIFDSNQPPETSTPPVHTGYTVPPLKPKKFRRKTTSKPEELKVEGPKTTSSEDSSAFQEVDSEKIIAETVRRRCPTCLNTNKKFIREFPDKSNIIMQYPRIYGKMYKCGLCTTTWK